VAAALAARLRERGRLVLGHVPVVVEVVAVGGREGGVEGAGDFFVVAALAGEEFALFGLGCLLVGF